MAGEDDAWSDDNLSKVIQAHPQAKELAKMQQASGALPEGQRVPLQGAVQWTPEMNATAEKEARIAFPQKGEAPAESIWKGLTRFGSAAGEGTTAGLEDLANLGLVGGQQLAGVPQEQRQTVGTLMRQVPGMQGAVTPSELMRSAAWQNEMAKAGPAFQVPNVAGTIAGGFVQPMKIGAQAMTQIPLLVRAAEGAGPAMARITALGNEIPIVKNMAENVRALTQSAPYTGIQKLLRNSLVGGAGMGAGYGAAYSAGNVAGDRREMPNPGELGAAAAVGGGLGAGLHALGGIFAKKRMEQELAPHAAASPIETNRATETPLEVIPEPEEIEHNLRTLLARITSDPTTNSTQKLQAGTKLLEESLTKYGGESFKHRKAINDSQKEFHRHIQGEAKWERGQAAKQASTQDTREHQAGVRQERYQRADEVRQDNRQYSEDARDYRRAEKLQDRTHTEGRQDLIRTQQTRRADDLRDENQRHQQQREEAGRERTAQHTEEGNADYNDLHDMISDAQSQKDMEDLRKMIYSSGPGAEGAAKLRPDQRMDLIDHWRQQYNQKFPRQEETPPGKPEGPEPPSGPENKILGMFRKLRAGQGKREDRPSFFLNISEFARQTGMTAEEELAVRDYVAQGAVIRREQTYHEKQLDELLKWAFDPNNLKGWIEEQHPGGVSARERIDEDGTHAIQLQNKVDQGKVKNITLRAQIRGQVEKATGQKLEYTQRKTDGGISLVVEGKPRIRFTTCGVTPDYAPTPDGAFKGTTHPIELEPFQAPKTADEMYDRVIHLQAQIDQAVKDLSAHKDRFEGTAERAIREAFERTKLPWINGEAPNTGVHYVDKHGVTTTAEFQQAPTKANYESAPQEIDPEFKYMGEAIEKATDKDGRVDYSVLKRDKRFNAALHIYVPGVTEIGTAISFIAPELHRALKGFAELTGLNHAFSGTIMDICEDHGRMGGQKVADEYYRNCSEIWWNFFHDKEGALAKVTSADEMAQLVQEFRHAPEKTRSGFRYHARKTAKELAQKEGHTYTQADEDEAIKRADTASMIVNKWAELADTVQQHLDEMAIRKTDSETGIASSEGKKFYLSTDYREDGYLKKGVYSRTYEDALRKLHDKLTMKPTQDFNGWGMMVPNLATSIFRNNVATAIKNVADQAPLTWAHFHFHLTGAIKDFCFDPELREAICRTPVHPANSAQNAEMLQALKDPRKMDWKDPGHASAQLLHHVNYWLSTKLDPIFHGSSPLLSAADVVYARLGAVASLRKFAWHRGIPWEDFRADLLSGKLSKQTEQSVIRNAKEGAEFATRSLQESAGMQLAKDNVQTTNTMGHGINVNMFADSPMGRATQMTATPGARAAKYVEGLAKNARGDTLEFCKHAIEGDWNKAFRSGGAGAKLTACMLGYIGLSGRGALDPSVQMIYKAINAAIQTEGANERAEKNLSELDNWNMLQRLTGIDYSNTSFGPSYLTNFAPAADAMEQVGKKLTKPPTGKQTLIQKAWDTSSIVAGDGLHMFPSWGPVGSEVAMRAVKRTNAAKEGKKQEYYPAENSPYPNHVTIPYNMTDVVRDSIFGGTNPKAKPLIDEQRMQRAKNNDAKYAGAVRMQKDLTRRQSARQS
jgi:hypothetical protein